MRYLSLALALIGFTGVASAVEVVAGPDVETTSDRATVRWQTDVVAGGRVFWGTTAGRFPHRAQGPTGTRHEVVLEGLKPGTTYYYTVGTARVVLGTNSFVTTGVSGVEVPPGTVNPRLGSGSGGSVGSPAARPQAPPARVTWGSLRTLQDHFERHGKDFGSRDADEYARQAWEFLQRAKRDGLPAKRDSEGVLRVYEPSTRSFAAYNRDGTTRTFFKPGRRNYFADQPGIPVNLKEER